MDYSTLITLIVSGVFALFCLLPLLFIGGLFIMVVTKFRDIQGVIDRIVIPDQSKLRTQFHQLRAANPDLEMDVLVKRIIRVQALKSGFIGFLIGLGGLITVPINVGASVRMQAATIHLIAYAFGSNESDTAMKRTTYLIMTGNQAVGQATQISARILQRFLLRILGRTVFRFLIESVPLLGALVGLVLNWAFTQFAGHLAIKWYTNPSLRAQAQQVLDKTQQTIDQSLMDIASGKAPSLKGGGNNKDAISDEVPSLSTGGDNDETFNKSL